jgi:mono/diheme cytochrome c family protein
LVCLAALPSSSSAAGFYTAAQADAGRTAFISYCAGCHGFRLQGMGAPTLKGRDFLAAWGTAQGLYQFFSVAMPASSPGSLSPETYTEVLAFLMSENGIPAGDSALAGTIDARAAIDLLQAAGLAGRDAAPQQ